MLLDLCISGVRRENSAFQNLIAEIFLWRFVFGLFIFSLVAAGCFILMTYLTAVIDFLRMFSTF